MPIRVYEIAKKLRLESKVVLAKAKELGIATAKVPSSVLDKITAEYLEEHLKSVATQSPSAASPGKPIVAATLFSEPEPKPPASLPHSESKPDTRFLNLRTLQQIQAKLQSQPNGRPYSARAFESDVNRLLNEFFPFSVLQGIRLFSSVPRGRIEYGFEIDNLIHLRHKEIDYVLEVEAKHQPVIVDKGKWLVEYADGPKCAREQLDNHIRTMWEYLRPIARQTELKFISIVVSSAQGIERRQADAYRNAELHLCSIGELPKILANRFNFDGTQDVGIAQVLRVAQSSFLDLLRLGLPVEVLGHPELASAIRYVDRCRRTLDETLFQKFSPTDKLWAINGSAGMGKSVLLAYTAAVLSSGFELYRALGDIGVKRAAETFARIAFNPDPKKGSIAIMAMSTKQLENIRNWFELFVSQFQQADLSGEVRFRPPEFLLCRSSESLTGLGERCSALLVDEAHDIPPFAASAIAELHAKAGIYLVVACDRHQKLRLAGADARIIEGLDFTNRSTRLRQIYRNPAPVYIASLGLMFRWFAESGPKVIPNTRELQEHFGFDATPTATGVEVLMRSDAHPANSWCHTVATFPSAAAAFGALVKERLERKDVLWVRYSEEDPEFDYERLIQHFTYHNCRAHDAHKISDKYIKGQDYPVVVIEGFPGLMDRFEAGGGETAEAAESRAWAFRRELYLCASRATAFLYFICNVPESSEVRRIRAELQRLVQATATPEKAFSSGTKSWKFEISRTNQTRKVDVFADAVAPTDVPSEAAYAAAAVIPSSESSTPQIQISEAGGLSKANAPSIVLPIPVESPVPEAVLSPGQQHVGVAAVSMMDSKMEVPAPVPKVPMETEAESVPLTPTASSHDGSDIDGEVAPLAEVAQRLGSSVDDAIARLRRIGFTQMTAATPVRVAAIVSLLQKEQASKPSEQTVLIPKAKEPIRASVAAPAPLDAKPILRVQRNITVEQLAALLGVKTHAIVAELIALKELRQAKESMSEESLRKICKKRGFNVLVQG